MRFQTNEEKKEKKLKENEIYERSKRKHHFSVVISFSNSLILSFLVAEGR
jgi:hypothetical protein